jgi:hypothetical protein
VVVDLLRKLEPRRDKKPAYWRSDFDDAIRHLTSAPPTIIPPCPTKTSCLSAQTAFLPLRLPLGGRQIARHHLRNQLGKTRLRLPAQFQMRLGSIADQELDDMDRRIGENLKALLAGES